MTALLTDPIDVVHRDELAYVAELRRRLGDVLAHVNRVGAATVPAGGTEGDMKCVRHDLIGDPSPGDWVAVLQVVQR